MRARRARQGGGMHTIKTEDEAVGGRGAGLDEGIRTKCIDMYRECQVKPILFLDSIQAKALIKKIQNLACVKML